PKDHRNLIPKCFRQCLLDLFHKRAFGGFLRVKDNISAIEDRSYILESHRLKQLPQILHPHLFVAGELYDAEKSNISNPFITLAVLCGGFFHLAFWPVVHFCSLEVECGTIQERLAEGTGFEPARPFGRRFSRPLPYH